MREKHTFHSVSTVRGLAALAVCWFHMGAWSGLLTTGLLYKTSHLGWMGPYIFFIVSGFVVPWSLYVAGYRWRDAPRYLARRLIRLDPPYLATIGLVLAMAYVAYALGFKTEMPEVSWQRMASHLAYLASIRGEEWYNPVFWTLALEFQFYLLIGVLLPLMRGGRAMRWAVMALCLMAYAPYAHTTNFTWVTSFLPLFMLGFLLFQYHARMIGVFEMTLWGVLLCALIAWSFAWYLAVTALVAFLFMLLDRWRHPLTEWLGEISYSLYLVHWPVGIALVRLFEGHVDSDAGRLGLALSAVVFTTLVAWVFYLLVERPSVHMARRMKTHKSTVARVTSRQPAVN